MKYFFTLLLVMFSINIFPYTSYMEDQINQYSELGNDALAKGDLRKAVNCFTKTLEFSKTINNSNLISLHSYYLATCYTYYADYDKALELIDDGFFELNLINSVNYDLSLLKAEIMIKKNFIKEAKEILNTLLQKITVKNPKFFFKAHLLMAQINFTEKDLNALEAELILMEKTLKKSNAENIDSITSDVKAKIFLLKNDYLNAAEFFDKKVSYTQKSFSYNEMQEALENAGDAYLNAGNADKAALRYYQASRSYLSMNETKKCKELLEKIAKIPEIKDIHLKTQIEKIKKESKI